MSVLLPPRYQTEWRGSFHSAMRARLLPGTTVLDIGSGRNPSIPRAKRPPELRWIGLDVSRPELVQAEPGAYDEIVVADIAEPVTGLTGRIDLAVSWQVLEHVRPLDRALANIHSHLRDGGALVSLFSASWSAFALFNRALPNRVGAALVGRTMRRRGSRHPVFPAHYDRCYASALKPLFADWASASIEPIYCGATYLDFAPPLQRAYLLYENAVMRHRLENLATHYFVVATR